MAGHGLTAVQLAVLGRLYGAPSAPLLPPPSQVGASRLRDLLAVVDGMTDAELARFVEIGRVVAHLPA